MAMTMVSIEQPRTTPIRTPRPTTSNTPERTTTSISLKFIYSNVSSK